MFKRTTPYERQWADLNRRETRFLASRDNKKDTIINQKLEKFVPDKLQATLDEAFAKVFALIFEKGTGVIEKTYNKDKINKKYDDNEYAYLTKQSNRNLNKFSKKARKSSTGNVIVSGAAGIGMGIAGVGIPDIPVFTAILFRSIYEIALNYGYDYENERERNFILLVIQGGVSYGMELMRINAEIDTFIKTGKFGSDIDITAQIKKTSALLSRELLYMKFLQGIPIAGAIGGFYDVVYLKNITEYANIKYKRRFLEKR